MNHRRPAEPPLSGYTRSTTRREFPVAGVVTGAVVLLIAVIAVYVVLQDSPARGAADQAAVVVKPTATAGVAVRKPTEYSPPLPEELPGDGMWIVGKQIRTGVYQSEAGALCYWERLKGLSGKYVDIIDNGGFRKGPTLVQVFAGDFAFSSQGCGKWVLVR